MAKKQETKKVFARGFCGKYLDADFNEEHIAEMSDATYQQLLTDFPGADISILEEQEDGK